MARTVLGPSAARGHVIPAGSVIGAGTGARGGATVLSGGHARAPSAAAPSRAATSADGDGGSRSAVGSAAELCSGSGGLVLTGGGLSAAGRAGPGGRLNSPAIVLATMAPATNADATTNRPRRDAGNRL